MSGGWRVRPLKSPPPERGGEFKWAVFGGRINAYLLNRLRPKSACHYERCRDLTGAWEFCTTHQSFRPCLKSERP